MRMVSLPSMAAATVHLHEYKADNHSQHSMHGQAAQHAV